MLGKSQDAISEYKNIRNFYLVSFLVSFIMLFILVCKGDIPVLSIIIMPILLLAIPIFNKTSLILKYLNLKWLIVFTMLNLLIMIPELSLRLVNFSYEPGVDYGNLAHRFSRLFIPDKRLMWKYSPDLPGVNSYGFYGPEIVIPKPPNVRRILFFGDSCAEQNYARILEKSLNNNTNSDIRFECLIFAIAGYSSYQGKILVEDYAKVCEADLAIVCYGWNDHWLALNGTDDEHCSGETSYLANILIHHSKILQLTRKLIADPIEINRQKVSNIVRVPINKYKDNIYRMTEELHHNGTKSILLTAPTSFYHNGVPDYIISSGLAIDRNAAVSKHREYNEIVRDIVSDQNCYLLDAEAIISQLEKPDSLFLKDGIHYSPAGLNYMASLIYSFMIENHLI